MRTIIVIFTDKKVSFNEAASYKRYKFLCNYGVVSIYDMVEVEKYKTLTDLAIIAKFFNGSWKKTINNAGYFISNCSRRNNVVCTCNGVDIYQHLSVQHAGIIYFKNKEDVIKAVEILGNRVKNLFD